VRFSLYWTSFLEQFRKEISNWLDENTLRAKGQARFRGKQSTINHILTFSITALLISRKSFDTSEGNILNCMEDLGIPFELGFAINRLYGY
jgi:hypothetical protein